MPRGKKTTAAAEETVVTAVPGRSSRKGRDSRCRN